MTFTNESELDKLINSVVVVALSKAGLCNTQSDFSRNYLNMPNHTVFTRAMRRRASESDMVSGAAESTDVNQSDSTVQIAGTDSQIPASALCSQPSAGDFSAPSVITIDSPCYPPDVSGSGETNQSPNARPTLTVVTGHDTLEHEMEANGVLPHHQLESHEAD